MELINIQQEITNTLRVLKRGGLILYPTDTIWGIGCDATNSNAVKKIFKIKRRNEKKSLISLVADEKQLKRIVRLEDKINIETSGPTTIIYNNIIGLAKNLLSNNSSAGIRIVEDMFCKKLIREFNYPIVSTSANISGEKFPEKFSDISNEIINNVDYVVNLRKNEIMNKPSKIITIAQDGSIRRLR